MECNTTFNIEAVLSVVDHPCVEDDLKYSIFGGIGAIGFLLVVIQVLVTVCCCCGCCYCCYFAFKLKR
jgi:hypothetical protein